MDNKSPKVVLGCFGSEGPPHDEGLNVSQCLNEYGKEVLKSGIDEFLAFTPRTLQEAIGVERAKRATKVYGEEHKLLPPYHKVGLGAWRAEILKYAVDTHSDGDIVIIHDPNYIKYPGILKHFAPNARKYALAAMEIAKDSEIFSPMCLKVIHTVSRGAVLDVIDKCKDAVITNPDTIADYPSARCRSIIVKISPKTRRFAEDFSRLCADESILSPRDRSRPGGWGKSGFIHHAGEQAIFNALAYVGGYFDIVRDRWIRELNNLGGESSDNNFPGDMGTYKLIKRAGLDITMNIKFVVHTLRDRGRADCVDALSTKIPNLVVRESVNGYDVTETRNSLKNSGLVYNQRLPEQWKCFRKYGTVACFLTKFNILQRQIEERTDFVCLLEDDVEVLDGFVDQVKGVCNILSKNPELTSARMTLYSGVLIFPLSGAERIVSQIKKFGIMKNIDDQIINYNPKCFDASPDSGVRYVPRHSLLHKTESFDPGELHKFSL